MTKWQFIYVAVVGALAVVSLAFPTLIFLGLMLGLVPGLILWAAIPLFGYSLLAITVRNQVFLLPAAWRWGIIAAATAVLAVVPPAIMNFSTGRSVDALTSGDRPLAEPLPKIGTLGYFGQSSPSYGVADCDDICQRLLYNGAVGAVIVGASLFHEELEFSKDATLYRIERHPTCPAIVLQRPSELLDAVKSRVAGGECLIREKADISQAEVVVGHAKQTRRDRAQTKIPRLRSVERVALYMRTPQGLEEKFRRTNVQYNKVVTPFLFGYFADGNLFSGLGVATFRADVNAFKLADVLMKEFRLDATDLPDLTAQQDRELLAAAIADKSRSPDDPAFALADKILRHIERNPPKDPKADVALIAAIIGDTRVRNVGGLAGAVWRLGSDGSSLAGVLIDRIMARDADVDADRGEIKATSHAISMLPQGALTPVMDKLRTLAADRNRRSTAYEAIARLADGGADTTPLLAELLRAGWDAKDGADDWNAADLQIGALLGLCRLGVQASAAAPELVALFNESEVKRDNLSSRGKLLIKTLNRMGQWPQTRVDLKASQKMLGQIDHATGSGKLERDCRY